MTAPHQTAPDQTRPQFLSGLSLAVVVVCISAAERFDRANAEVAAYGDQVQRGWLPWGWMFVAFIGTGFAAWAGVTVVKVARSLGGKRSAVLPWLIVAAVLAWFVWQVTGALVAWGVSLPEAGRAPLHWAAIVLAVAAIGWAGGVVAGDATEAWERASVVGLQIILLAVLLAAVLVLPITSDQCLDVLRAWGDGPYTRAAVGLAGGLLLGAVCRSSARRLLIPEGRIETYHLRRGTDWVVSKLRHVIPVPVTRQRRLVAVLPWAIPLVLVAAGLAYLRWWPAFIALAGIIVMAIVTKWAAPPSPEVSERATLERLAGTLGVVPLGIVLAGLSSAAVDSLLLPSPLTGTDGVLVAYAVAAFAGFWLLCADAHTRRGVPMRAKRRRLTVGVIAALGFAAALMPGLDLGQGADVAAASLLLVVAVVVAARCGLPRRGAAEFWVGGAVVLGAAVAVYAEPIAAARTLGAFGLVFIGATGVLLLLHLAGTIGARRAFRASIDGLPDRAPVVALLGVWVLAAFFLAPDTVHQVRTVQTQEKPQLFGDAVGDWLDAQAARPVRPEHGSQYVPMLLVAASGGGAKAAYWTDLVADCLFGSGVPTEAGSAHECRREDYTPARYARLFLTSSVSGGSVGVRHLVANAAAMTRGEPWVERAAAPESLSPVVGWGFFHDLPAFMLGARLNPRKCVPGEALTCRRHADRVLVQEAAAADVALEAPPGRTLLKRQGPVTVFNAAEAGAARRVLLARVGLSPLPRRLGCGVPQSGDPVNTAVDAHDVLGSGLDVPLGTAAFASARFPVVAPPARIGERDPPDSSGCARRPFLAPVLARDGGYIENSGVLTIAELLPTLNREIELWRAEDKNPVKIRPIVISIDDDPVKRTEEELDDSPRGVVGISRTAGPGFLTAGARAAIESCAFPGVSYFRISPPRRVGAKAATGWEISETTRFEDLADGIANGPKARAALDHVRQILAGEARPNGCEWQYLN